MKHINAGLLLAAASSVAFAQSDFSCTHPGGEPKLSVECPFNADVARHRLAGWAIHRLPAKAERVMIANQTARLSTMMITGWHNDYCEHPLTEVWGGTSRYADRGYIFLVRNGVLVDAPISVNANLVRDFMTGEATPAKSTLYVWCSEQKKAQ